MDAIAVVDEMIVETCRVAGQVAQIPGAESLNAGTAIGVRIQVLRDVKSRLMRERARELEIKAERAKLGLS